MSFKRRREKPFDRRSEKSFKRRSNKSFKRQGEKGVCRHVHIYGASHDSNSQDKKANSFRFELQTAEVLKRISLQGASQTTSERSV